MSKRSLGRSEKKRSPQQQPPHGARGPTPATPRPFSAAPTPAAVASNMYSTWNGDTRLDEADLIHPKALQQGSNSPTSLAVGLSLSPAYHHTNDHLASCTSPNALLKSINRVLGDDSKLRSLTADIVRVFQSHGLPVAADSSSSPQIAGGGTQQQGQPAATVISEAIAPAASPVGPASNAELSLLLSLLQAARGAPSASGPGGSSSGAGLRLSTTPPVTINGGKESPYDLQDVWLHPPMGASGGLPPMPASTFGAPASRPAQQHSHASRPSVPIPAPQPTQFTPAAVLPCGMSSGGGGIHRAAGGGGYVDPHDASPGVAGTTLSATRVAVPAGHPPLMVLQPRSLTESGVVMRSLFNESSQSKRRRRPDGRIFPRQGSAFSGATSDTTDVPPLERMSTAEGL